MRYTEQVTRWCPVTKEESIEVPVELVKLVNGNDQEYGRNGYHYMGCNRKRQGGTTIDRLQEYIQYHKSYHNPLTCDCPVKLGKEAQ